MKLFILLPLVSLDDKLIKSRSTEGMIVYIRPMLEARGYHVASIFDLTEEPETVDSMFIGLYDIMMKCDGVLLIPYCMHCPIMGTLLRMALDRNKVLKQLDDVLREPRIMTDKDTSRNNSLFHLSSELEEGIVNQIAYDLRPKQYVISPEGVIS